MTMKISIQNLLTKICVEKGFCLAANEIEEIASKDYLDARSFAKLVLIAEGMNPDMEIEHFRSIKRVFTELFGNEVCEADF